MRDEAVRYSVFFWYTQLYFCISSSYHLNLFSPCLLASCLSFFVLVNLNWSLLHLIIFFNNSLHLCHHHSLCHSPSVRVPHWVTLPLCDCPSQLSSVWSMVLLLILLVKPWPLPLGTLWAQILMGNCLTCAGPPPPQSLTSAQSKCCCWETSKSQNTSLKLLHLFPVKSRLKLGHLLCFYKSLNFLRSACWMEVWKVSQTCRDLSARGAQSSKPTWLNLYLPLCCLLLESSLLGA